MTTTPLQSKISRSGTIRDRSVVRGQKRCRCLPSSEHTGRINRFHYIPTAVFLSLLVLMSLLSWNTYYVMQELEAPLDHFWSVVQKPFVYCPYIPQRLIPQSLDNTTTFTMISARPWDQVKPVLDSWRNAGVNVIVHSTLEASRNFTNTKCQHTQWKTRLFALYQGLFLKLLQERSEQDPDYNRTDPYFCIVEDDLILLDVDGLRSELEWVGSHDQMFYSFHPNKRNNTPESSCIYQYGTYAFCLHRILMLDLINVPLDTFCRIPIDMAVAQSGPWYTTTRPLTQHIGKRLNVV